MPTGAVIAIFWACPASLLLVVMPTGAVMAIFCRDSFFPKMKPAPMASAHAGTAVLPDASTCKLLQETLQGSPPLQVREGAEAGEGPPCQGSEHWSMV